MKQTKICAHTMATPTYDVYQAVEVFASIGFDGLELVCADDYLCAIDSTISDAELHRLKRHADGYGVEIAALVPYVADIWVADDAVRRRALDELKRTIDIAEALDCRSLRILAGRSRPADGQWRDAVSRTIESLEELAAHLKGEQLFVNVENHMSSMAQTSEETLAIVTAVGSAQVGIIFDPANLHTNGEWDVEAALEQQAAFIRHVHVKDFRYFDNGRGFPVLLGEGDIPWRQLIDQLSRHAYNGYLSMEYEKRWRGDQLPESPVALRHDLKVLRDLIGAA